MNNWREILSWNIAPEEEETSSRSYLDDICVKTYGVYVENWCSYKCFTNADAEKIVLLLNTIDYASVYNVRPDIGIREDFTYVSPRFYEENKIKYGWIFER